VLKLRLTKKAAPTGKSSREAGNTEPPRQERDTLNLSQGSASIAACLPSSQFTAGFRLSQRLTYPTCTNRSLAALQEPARSRRMA
jgi:hypothetical protein